MQPNDHLLALESTQPLNGIAVLAGSTRQVNTPARPLLQRINQIGGVPFSSVQA